MIRHAVEKDGMWYFTTGPCSVPGRGQMLYAYNMETREITEIGRPVPKAEPINDTADMELLKNIGADCIMSDIPDVAYEVLNA